MPKYLFYALIELPNKLDTSSQQSMEAQLFKGLTEDCIKSTMIFPVIEMHLDDFETVGGMQ